MAVYNDAILTSLQVSNGFIDKAKIDTRLSSRMRLNLARVETKIAATTNLSSREIKWLESAFLQLMAHIKKNTPTHQGQ